MHIHSYNDLVSIIPICNDNLERESVLNEFFLNKHVYNNVKMSNQSIPKLELHEGQCEKCFFIFYVANNLDNGHLNKFYELKDTNNQQIVYGKLMP